MFDKIQDNNVLRMFSSYFRTLHAGKYFALTKFWCSVCYFFHFSCVLDFSIRHFNIVMSLSYIPSILCNYPAWNVSVYFINVETIWKIFFWYLSLDENFPINRQWLTLLVWKLYIQIGKWCIKKCASYAFHNICNIYGFFPLCSGAKKIVQTRCESLVVTSLL